MPIPILLFATSITLLLGATAPALAATADPLADYLWTKRVLLVCAGSTADQRFAAQKTIFVGMTAEARDRDLVMVKAVDDSPDAQALRHKFGVGPEDFAVLLIGKDGGEKLRSAAPLSAEEILPVIDAMPMRQSESQRSRR